MNLEYIRSFLILARELHFWNAASKLNLPQSTLSRRIKILEEELSLQLFSRNKRNVKLTPAGKLLFERWTDIVEQLDLLHAFATKVDSGESETIIIGYPGSITYTYLPELLQKISILYPNLRIKLVEMMYKNTEEYLLNYKVDIALSRDTTKTKALTYQQLGKDHFAFVVAEDHHFKILEDIHSANWVEEKFILPPLNDDSEHTHVLLKILETYKIRPDVFYESDFGNTIISLVAKGMGISILPYSYSYSIGSNVRFIKIPFETNLNIIWREEDNSELIRKVINSLEFFKN